MTLELLERVKKEQEARGEDTTEIEAKIAKRKLHSKYVVEEKPIAEEKPISKKPTKKAEDK